MSLSCLYTLTCLRLVKILAVLVKYLPILYAESCNKYVYTHILWYFKCPMKSFSYRQLNLTILIEQVNIIGKKTNCYLLNFRATPQQLLGRQKQNKKQQHKKPKIGVIPIIVLATIALNKVLHNEKSIKQVMIGQIPKCLARTLV